MPLDGDGIKKDSDDHVHFIVVGMSKMGIAMGVQALLQAHYINYAAAEKEGILGEMEFEVDESDREERARERDVREAEMEAQEASRDLKGVVSTSYLW